MQAPAEHLFSSEDADGDGQVSWAEFSGPKGTAVDDRLRASTPEEIKALNQANAARAAQRALEEKKIADHGGDKEEALGAGVLCSFYCCAVLCCAVLSCAVLHCVVLCRPVQR